MSRTRTRPVLLQDAAAIEAVASPHRLEVVSALGEAEQASIAELARRLGRTPHSLYYHVKRLVSAGVVVPAETRRRGRRDERIWKLAGERILLGAQAGSTPASVKTSKAIDAMLRLTARELSAAVRRHHGRRDGAPTPITGVRMKGQLDERTVRRIVRLLDQIGRTVQAANRRSRPGRMFTITLVLAPTGDGTGEA